MITPITATFPALNFPKEIDYPTQEDWPAFSAAAELNYGILSGEWSDKSEEFKSQTNNLALEIQAIGENAINAISLDTIEDLATYTGTGLVMVKDINRGGTFISKTVIEIDPNTGSLYVVNDGTVFAKLGGGFWARQYIGAISVKWFDAKGDGVTNDTIAIQKALDFSLNVFFPKGTYYAKGLISRTNQKMFGEQGTLITSLDSTNILKQGTEDSSWGTGGSLYIDNISFQGSIDWASLIPIEGEALVELYSTVRLYLHKVSIEKGKSSLLYIKNTGYSTINKCTLLASNLDNICLDSTSTLNAITSTHISNSQISTGLRSSIHLNNVFNVTISTSQLEDSEAALLITGTASNNNITFKNNYVEATRGDYDIDFRTASGQRLSIIDNYLAGTPNIKTLGINTNGASNYQYITYSGNSGITSQPLHSGFQSLDWLKGARNTEGTAEITLLESTTSAQQTVRLKLNTANGYGASFKSSSIDGAYRIGLNRGTGFDSTDDGQAFFTQTYQNKGAINTAATENYALHIYGGSGTAKNQNSLKCSHVGGNVLYTGGVGFTMGGTPNAAAAALNVHYVSGGGRSINAAGTINASGADYAEYENNNGIKFEKGSIVGFKEDGTLTDNYNEAIRFGIKSTNPCIVGGDIWGSEEIIGLRPQEPTRIDDIIEKVQIKDSDEFEDVVIKFGETDAEWEQRENEYKKKLFEFETKLEAERQKVDRIAYSGKVPVNVYGAKAGQYIVAINKDGKIDGLLVNKNDVTFNQYKDVVGIVNKVLEDGRCEVAVIIH